MKRTAIIYTRVSTDDQKNGYSPAHQEEMLRKYCQLNNIEIVKHYFDDHSAKSFDRPEFKELLLWLRKNRNKVDLLLFLKWDRFSRNVADAYSMIGQLNKLGVEAQAIEQPLDMNIPESKIMLAFYLAAPEVENDRRSLNVIAGMRRAMKEGMHITHAPQGFVNARGGSDGKKPIIVPGEKAGVVKWIFEEVCKEERTIVDIWKEARKRGFTLSKSNIFMMLRNPVYYGKLFIPAYRNEPAMIVQGIHEPIISEALFNEVQDILNGRKKKHPATHGLKEELPLRGFLKCSKCGGQLTGSGSKGNGGRYFYYHCISTCGVRFKASEANEAFVAELGKISMNEQGISLFEEVMKDYYGKAQKAKGSVRKDIDAVIEKNQQRISNAQQMMVDGDITASEYREIKERYEPEVRRLTKQKSELTSVEENLMDYVGRASQLLRNLPQYYVSASLRDKQKLIGSMYPEKLVFENKAYRTTVVNEVIGLICSIGAGSMAQKRKNGRAFAFPFLSGSSTRIRT